MRTACGIATAVGPVLWLYVGGLWLAPYGFWGVVVWMAANVLWFINGTRWMYVEDNARNTYRPPRP